MKNFRYILVSLMAVPMLTACDDFLTVNPDSYIKPEIFYSNKTEVEIGLAGIYGALAVDNVFGQVSLFFDAGADEGYYNRRGNENWTVSLYRHTPSDIYIRYFWAGLYESVNLSNLFIENLSRSSFEQSEYDSYLAEARFLRGFSYLSLTQWFDEVPIRREPSRDQSSNHVAPSPVADVYRFIAEDLLFAAEHLPHASDGDYVPGRANKMAAHGLLARLYLKQAGYPLLDESAYEDALKHCDIIINEDGWHDLTTSADGLGYRKHFLSYVQNEYDTKESLFEISFAYLRGMGVIRDGRVGGLNGLRFWLNGGLDGPSSYSMTNASPVLLNAYDDEDTRKDWNVPGVQYNNGNIARQTVLQDFFCPGKYRRWEPSDWNDINVSPSEGQIQSYTVLEKASAFNSSFTCVNLPVLRFSDVLLMYAEAENAVNGPTAAAIEALNRVRNRAGLDDIETVNPAAVASPDALQAELVEERMRELCFEGIRRHDLVRWGMLGERLQLLGDVLRGTPGFLVTSDQHVSYLRSSINFNPDRHLSLPYPLQEVSLNNELTQKPGWAGLE